MRKWLAILLLCLGLGLISYPAASNVVARWRQQGVLVAYKNQLQTASERQLKALQRSLQKQASVKQTATVKDPFKKNEKQFVETEPLALVAIPKINVELPVFVGTSEQVLQKYAGLVNGTDIPQGKDNQHSLITAHGGLPGAQLFTDLWRVDRGDRFYLKNAYGLMTYEVTAIRTVKADTRQPINRSAARNQVTLMTCTPYMINTHRLLVTGKRIPNETEAIPPGKFVWDRYKTVVLILTILALTAGVWLGYRRYRRAKEAS
ncbi:class C sortase [Levilactobacillus parabrevis]|uniref:class C sortase n=1 Tax=Levilactobacillus parabrevis TaxID=357278 RepID=UPI000376F3BA|nr:class C sortase [Levilactobacillus parabrevis]